MNQPHDFQPVAGFSQDSQTWLGLEEPPEPIAKNRIFVSDDDPDRFISCHQWIRDAGVGAITEFIVALNSRRENGFSITALKPYEANLKVLQNLRQQLEQTLTLIR